jgi:sugar lactone lactonase YvrE
MVFHLKHTRTILFFVLITFQVKTLKAQIISTLTGANDPISCAYDGNGNLYYLHLGGNTMCDGSQVVKVNLATGTKTVVVGTGACGFSNGSGALTALLNYSRGIAFDTKYKYLYFVDQSSSVIRRVNTSFANSGVSTILTATGGSSGWFGDKIANDKNGNLYYYKTDGKVYKYSYASGTSSVIAGNGTSGSFTEGAIATSTTINPKGVTLDVNGNIYIIDDNAGTKIRKINAVSNVITTVATSENIGPSFIQVDQNGNVFFVESNTIRKVDNSGTLSLVAGGGSSGMGDGGPATSAQLSWPTEIAFDNSNNIFIADKNNDAIRMVSGCITDITTNFSSLAAACENSTTTLEILAGPGSVPYQWYKGSPNGTSTLLNGETSSGCTVTNSTTGWSSYFAKITSSCGIINSPVAVYQVWPTTTITNPNPGTQTVMQNSTPAAMYVSGGNNSLIVYQWYKNEINSNVGGTPLGTPQTGSAPLLPSTDNQGTAYYYATATQCGTATSATASVTVTPFSVASNPHVITKVAGTGAGLFNGDDGPAVSASIYYPADAVIDAQGNMYIADRNNNRIRKVDGTTGIITTIAGTGTFGFYGEGVDAKTAMLGNPTGITFDPSGNLIIADAGNRRIRKIDLTTGLITTLVGTGATTFNDGVPALSANLYLPTDCAFDAAGNLYIVDMGHHRVRKVNTNGIISTVAGNGLAGFNQDEIVATSAQLNYPTSCAVDANGNIFISDRNNFRIRRVHATTGLISTVAGTGTPGYNGDNIDAKTASLNYPNGISFDKSGNLYIADESNNRVRQVRSDNIIVSVAGTGAYGASGDGGVATSATFNQPLMVVFDEESNLYIGDYFRIRKAWSCIYSLAAPSVSPNETICQGATASTLNTTAGPGALSYQWYSNSSNSNIGGSAIQWAVQSQYVPPTSTAGVKSYYATVTGTCGTLVTNVHKTVTVNPTTIITHQPSTAKQNVCTESEVTPLTIAVIGTGLTYQWYRTTSRTYPADTELYNYALTDATSIAHGSRSATYTPYHTPDYTPFNPAGYYHYFVIVYGGCGPGVKSNFSGPVGINLRSRIISQPPAARLFCLNSTATALNATVTGVDGTVSWQWYVTPGTIEQGTPISGASGSQYISAGHGENIYYTPPTSSLGTSYYYAVTTFACGSTTSALTGAISVTPLTRIDVQPSTSTQTICKGGSATTLSVTASGTGPLSYQWFKNTTSSNVGGAVIDGATGSTYTPLSSTVGSSWYYVTVIGTCGTVSSNASGEIIINELPTVDITPSATSICMGLSTELQASGAVSYSWSPPMSLSATSGATVTASPGSTTTYTVTGVGANGCPRSKTVTVTVNPLPNVSADAATASICYGSATSIAANGATSYLWAAAPGLPATTGAMVSVSPGVNTTYTVTGTDDNGCVKSATASVVVNPLPNVTVDPVAPSICYGTDTLLTAYGASSYTWSSEPGLSVTTGNIVTASPGSTTTYTVTGTDANGCPGSKTVTVTVNPLPNVTVDPSATSICYGTSTSLKAFGANSYLWSPGTGLSDTAGNPVTASPGSTTTYMVKGIDDNGCKDSETITITVNSLPTPTVSGSTSICQGSITSYSTESGKSNYTWTISGGSIITGSGTNVIKVSWNASGSKKVSVNYNFNGCAPTAPAVLNVTVKPSSAYITVSGDACAGYTLTASYGSAYKWSTGAATQSIKTFATGTFWVDVTNTNGCVARAYYTIGSGPGPEARIGNFNHLNSDPETTIEPCPTHGSTGSSVSVNIYPNKADKEVFIRVTQDMKLQTHHYVLYDQFGTIASKGEFNAEQEEAKIETLDLASGVYVIEITNEKGTHRQKVLIAH